MVCMCSRARAPDAFALVFQGSTPALSRVCLPSPQPVYGGCPCVLEKGGGREGGREGGLRGWVCIDEMRPGCGRCTERHELEAVRKCVTSAN